MAAQQTHRLRDVGVVGQYRAAVSERAEVLRWIKAERRRVGEGAGPAAVVLGAVGLSGVLDDPQTVSASDGRERLHVGALPVEVYRYERPSPRRHCVRDGLGVQREG